MFLALSFVCTVLLSAATRAQPAPPQWPSCYTAMGVLRLPYAELKEPFMAYYEAKKSRSRIDYYGLVETYQIGGDGTSNYGTMYKVAPMTTEEFVNVMHCFQVNGTVDQPVSPQNILPDLTGFVLSGSEVVNGVTCNVWKNVTVVGEKRNVYKLWQSLETKLPVRYQMMGYDSLLGSHYDNYYVDYMEVKVYDSLPNELFTVASNLTCAGFPGPGVSHRRITMNPICEFIHNDIEHVDELFHKFKKTHGKDYAGNAEHSTRKNNFQHNLRYINSKNRAGLSYKLAVNHLADMSDAEMRMMRGRKHSVGYNGGLPFNKNLLKARDIPDQIDWRLFGAVTPVKDQAVCGSCWSFGTTGAIEGAHFMKTGQLVRLSTQELVDCSWGEGNNGCDGGEDFRAYQWILKHGQASEEDYGAYLGVDGNCVQMNVNATANMKGYVNVTSGDLSALKVSIAKMGPVSVAIDASHRSLSFYSNGVYYEPACGSKLENLDHAVLAVGYGTLNGEPYWLVKNSWSTYWGNDGYVLMSQKDNNCGVATAATYVLM